MSCTLQGAPECQSFVFNEDGKCTSYTGGEPSLCDALANMRRTSEASDCMHCKQCSTPKQCDVKKWGHMLHFCRVHHGPAGGQHTEDGRAVRHSGRHWRGGAAAGQMRIMLLSTAPLSQHSSVCGTPAWRSGLQGRPGSWRRVDRCEWTSSTAIEQVSDSRRPLLYVCKLQIGGTCLHTMTNWQAWGSLQNLKTLGTDVELLDWCNRVTSAITPIFCPCTSPARYTVSL
jgi:hypothetical protein